MGGRRTALLLRLGLLFEYDLILELCRRIHLFEGGLHLLAEVVTAREVDEKFPIGELAVLHGVLDSLEHGAALLVTPVETLVKEGDEAGALRLEVGKGLDKAARVLLDDELHVRICGEGACAGGDGAPKVLGHGVWAQMEARAWLSWRP